MIATIHSSDEELMAFAEGELPQGEMQATEAHLQECEECTARLAACRGGAESLDEELATWSTEPIPKRVERVVLGALASRGRGEAGGRSVPTSPHIWGVWGAGRWRLWAGAGACVAFLVLVIASGVGTHQQPQPFSKAKLSEPESVVPSPSSAAPAKMPKAEDRWEMDKAVVPGGLANPEAAAPPPPPPVPIPQKMAALRAAPPSQSAGARERRNVRTPASTEPMIAHNATLHMTVDNVDRERVVLEGLLARYGGYAAQMQVNTSTESPRSLTASLRVPVASLAQVLADLRTLGHVENESQSGEDVGQDHADLQARLNTARSTEERLRGILREHTGSVSDVLEVEQEIASTREKIESMEAELDGMEHRVHYATIDLQLSEAAAKPATGSVGARLGNAISAGWHNAGELLLGLALWLAEDGLEIAVVLLLLCVPGAWLWRRYKRLQSKL